MASHIVAPSSAGPIPSSAFPNPSSAVLSPSFDGLRSHPTLSESIASLYSTSPVSGYKPSGLIVRSCVFDGRGNFFNVDCAGNNFCWHHVEPSDENKDIPLSEFVKALSPPLSLRDILFLLSNGRCCEFDDNALFFHFNFPRPASSRFTSRIAAKITENSILTVSLGHVPRLGFSKPEEQKIPMMKDHGDQLEEQGRVSITSRDLNFKDSECGNNPVPCFVSEFTIHIMGTYVEHVQDCVTNLEVELHALEFETQKGGYDLKMWLLSDGTFSRMDLDLQHLMKIIVHGEHMFLSVKEKSSKIKLFATKEVGALYKIGGQLTKLRERVSLLSNRAVTNQATLVAWQTEPTNYMLIYISCIPALLLFAIIVFSLFRMNAAGLPWTNGLVLGLTVFAIVISGMTIWRNNEAMRNKRYYRKKWRCGGGLTEVQRIMVDVEAVAEVERQRLRDEV